MSKRSRRLRFAAGTIVALVAVFGAVPAAILGLSLARAHESLAAAGKALGSDDVAIARAHLNRAISSASSAASVAEGPLLGGLAGVTGLGNDLTSLSILAEVALDGARAAMGVLDQAVPEDGRGDGVGAALYRGGRIDLEAVHRLGAAVAVTRDVLDRSSDAIASAPDPMFGAVDDALDRAREEIVTATGTAEKAISLLALLPGLAGEEEPRSYLVAFQSPSEARGGGGLIGVYGILIAKDGSLALEHVGPIEELVVRQEGSVDAPRWFEDLYGNFRATKEFRSANMSPHFPTTAQLWLEMYRRLSGVALDGVIALDPFALGELTAGTGPLSAEGWDRRIDKENVRRVLLHDVYRHFDHEERIQNEYLRGLIDALWERLEDPGLRVADSLRGLGEAAVKQRVKVFSAHPDEQALLADIGVAGDQTIAGPSVQMLYNNNFAANKVDYFLHRTVQTAVGLHEDGTADVDVEILLENAAPSGKGSVLVRPLRRDLPSGVNDMIWYLLMPEGSEPKTLSIDGTDSNILEGRDGAYPVAWQPLAINPQKSATVRLSYRWPSAVTDRTFELTLWPQAAARPDSFSLKVTAPPGYGLRRGPGAAREVVSVDGRLRRPMTLRWELIALDDES